MRDPRAVVAVVHLAALVGDHLRERRVVGCGVALDRDLRGHAAHRVRAPAMTGLDEKLRVRPQEPLVHRDLRPVGKNRAGVVPMDLDEAEDVVPPAAVETRGVLAELPEDLVHLEGGGKRLDQHRRLDRPRRERRARSRRARRRRSRAGPRDGSAASAGRSTGPVPLAISGLGVVEEEDPEIEERGGDRAAIHLDVLLDEMPAARADHQDGGLLPQAVALAGVGVVVGDRSPNGVDEVGLAVHDVGPRRRVRVFEVGHEHRRARSSAR